MKLSQILSKLPPEIKAYKETIIVVAKKAVIQAYWKFCWEEDPHNAQLAQRFVATNANVNQSVMVLATFMRDEIVRLSNGTATASAIYVLNGVEMNRVPGTDAS